MHSDLCEDFEETGVCAVAPDFQRFREFLHAHPPALDAGYPRLDLSEAGDRGARVP